MRVESSLYERLNQTVRCLVCNHKCVIQEGQKGICRTRINEGGRLYSTAYGIVMKEAVEPIEKNPLFHFWPGSATYSIGGYGCNFGCPWCRQWGAITDFLLSIVNPEDGTAPAVQPEKLVEAASNLEVDSITYCFNEPSIWFEFVRDTARLGREKGLRNVLVTNGYYSREALEEYRGLIDAVNIDIKAFTEKSYQKYVKASLRSTLEMAKETKNAGLHVELTMLLIPTLNDGMEHIKGFIAWVIDEMGPQTPVHFARFFPKGDYSHLPPTPMAALLEAWKAARDAGLAYVYVQNVPGVCTDTVCPRCQATVIGRRGSRVTEWHLDGRNRCKRCETEIPIVGRWVGADRPHLE
ncbi:MAG TPA: AmmeMemoRadiSam system radical SAM enzyme [Anaerolineae bacterium]|nr:AmmeMemoRadiSam system radical SAM enzyme [Anaerolineae bacterium]